jgi:hypothetical protein
MFNLHSWLPKLWGTEWKGDLISGTNGMLSALSLHSCLLEELRAENAELAVSEGEMWRLIFCVNLTGPWGTQISG